MKTFITIVKRLSLMMMFLFFSAFLSINAQTAWTDQTYDPDVTGIEMNPMKGLMPGYEIKSTSMPYSTDHFYIRFNQIIDKTKGQYDWTEFENRLKAKAVGGRTVVARIWTFYNSSSPLGVPQYLIDEGVTMYGICPDWNHPNLNQGFKDLIAAFGKQYDGDPRIVLIEAGLYGSWGEWNIESCPSGVDKMTQENMDGIITAYDNAFNTTHVALRYGDKAGTEALARSVGYYDDSFCYETLYASWCFWPKIITKGIGDVWETHPIAGELRPEVQEYIFDQWPNASSAGGYNMEDITECVNTAHSSFVKAYYLWKQAPTATEKTNAIKMTKMMGYEFYVRQVKLTPNSDNTVKVEVKLQNRAAAPIYYNWDVEFGAMKDGNFTLLNKTDWNITGIIPDPTSPTYTDYTKSATTSSLPNGDYKILMRFKNPLLDAGYNEAMVLRFANEKQDSDRTGWLTLGTATIGGTSTTNYTLTETSPNGNVTFSPSGGTYAAGTVVTVTAVPNSGYQFSSWSGDLSGSTNPTTITMNANKSVTANFTALTSGEALPWVENFTKTDNTTSDGAPTSWTATNMRVLSNEMAFNNVGADGVFTTGAINISSGPVTVSVKVRGGTGLDVGQDFLKLYKKVDGGAEVQIAAANGPQAAATWTVTNVTGSSLVLVLRAHVTATSEYYYFDDLSVVSGGTTTYTLSETSTNGSVTFSPAGGTYAAGTVVTVTAVPASGYTFSSWGGDLSSSGSTNPTTITMNSNKSISASFTTGGTAPDVAALTAWISGTTNTKVAGSNRMMVVMVMGEHASSNFSATAVTYGGQSMTKVTEQVLGTTYRTYAAIFTLKESGVNLASSGEINVAWSTAPAGFSVYSVLLANVDQTAAITSAKNALTGTFITTISPLAAASGDMVVMCGATAANITQTFNNSFIKQFESNTSWGDGVGGNKMGTGVSETPKFTQSASGRMVICGMVVKKSTVLKSAIMEGKIVDVKNSDITIYPNPVSNRLYVDFKEEGIKNINIYNSNGQLVYSNRTSDLTANIDVKALNVKGFAMIQIISDQKSFMQKILVK